MENVEVVACIACERSLFSTLLLERPCGVAGDVYQKRTSRRSKMEVHSRSRGKSVDEK